ncbi:hypothetical protein ABZT03_40105, partial [Streptomyces sp. NPDC005574]
VLPDGAVGYEAETPTARAVGIPLVYEGEEVKESLIPTVVKQRITIGGAHYAWRRLLTRAFRAGFDFWSGIGMSWRDEIFEAQGRFRKVGRRLRRTGSCTAW